MSTGLPSERIVAALDELLAWPVIARSPQLGGFLRYIVEATLRGEEGGIKAYSIAVDVFGRPASFDPQSDPIVRVQARRLRSLLDQYYAEGRGKAGVQIRLPVGRYVPEFVVLDAPAEPEPESQESPGAPATAGEGISTTGDRAGPEERIEASPSRPRSVRLVWFGGAALALAALVAMTALLLSASDVNGPPEPPPPAAAGPPSWPALRVGGFANLTGMPALDAFGLRLSAAVEAGLRVFDDLEILQAPADASVAAENRSDYLVSGVINPGPQGVKIAAEIIDADGDTIWTAGYSHPISGGGETDPVATLAKAIVRAISPLRGPIHERGRKWLDREERPLVAVSPYVCLLTYRLARESGSSTHIADALSCHTRLLREEPGLPIAMASEAMLLTRAQVTQLLPGDNLSEMIAPYRERAVAAQKLMPESSLVNELAGTVLAWSGQFDDALRAYALAIRLNPLNTDARAAYAVALSRGVNWAQGGEQAEIAIADAAYPSPWYYYPVAINALRLERFDQAIAAARIAARFAAGELGSIIALAAAGYAGDQPVVDEFLPRVMLMESLRRWGIGPYLVSQVVPPSVDLLLDGLRRAGVAESALTGAF